MGTRRAFVFTNFIFFVQNLLLLLLTWNVSSTTSPPPPPSLALFPSRQQHPVDRTLYASRPSRGSKTGEEAVLASTQTPVEERKLNNFPTNISPFPLSSSVILLKYQKHLADKKTRSEVKQLDKDKSNDGSDSTSYSRSPLRTNYITPLHMTVNLKGSVIPLIHTFGALSSVTGKKSIESSSSSSSSSSSERFLRLGTYYIQSLLAPPTTSTTPTSLSNSASSIFSTSKQNLKTPSFTASNSSSFSSKKYRHRQISSGRKKINKRSKELLSAKEKHKENLNVITSVADNNGTYYINHTLNNGTYYINHTLNYLSQNNQTKGKLYQEKVRRKKRKSDKKLPETQSQRYARANARTSLLNDDSKRLFAYEKHIKTLSDSQTNVQQLLHQKSFPNSISESLQLKRDSSFENNAKSRHKEVKVENISQIQNSSILKRFVSPIGSLPVMTAQKRRELLAVLPPVPSSSSPVLSSSSILLRSLLIQKTTPDLNHSSILRPESHVDNVYHKTKQKVPHTNSNGAISSITEFSKGIELIAQQSENISDVETEVNDIISGNSNSKSEFMLYQNPPNRQKRIANQHEAEHHRNQSDTFITTSVYSSTLPTRSETAIDNMTTVSPLREINKLLLQKPTGNISLPRSKAEKHDDISNRHRRNIDENKKYLHKLTNSENKLKKRQQKYKQFKNRSEEKNQAMREKNMNSSGPFGNQISDRAKPYKNSSKMIKVRKKRSFLSDYEHYIEQEERKEIIEMENKEKLLDKGELFNDVSLDEVFAVQSQPRSKEKSHKKDNYEDIDFSARDSKISLSTLEFPPAEPVLLPPVIFTPENPKTLQVFKIASGDTRQSPVQRNQPEFGSGDELALSFLVPCTKREKYYCLNGGTCLIVYTMDVKTCRCPIGYSGQRCEQIDHDSYYSLLGDPAYPDESG